MADGGTVRAGIGDGTLDPSSSAHAVAPVYQSKLRAKREERMHQQHLQPLHSRPDEATASDSVTGLNDTTGHAPESTRSALHAPTAPIEGGVSTRSMGTEDARRRQRAEARRLLIEFSGTVWDVVRANDMPMLRNFFLVEGAAKLVQAHSKSIDEFGRTLLHTAAWWGHVDAAEFLIVNDATINEVDTVSTRLTPLMDAARAGITTIGLLLLQHGADATLRDASGDNAFHWAARHSHGTFLLQVSLKLDTLDHSALVEAWTTKNHRGRTPADYIRTHVTIFPMISKRLGDRVPLHRVAVTATATPTHRLHHQSSNAPGFSRSQSHGNGDSNGIAASAASRPVTAQTLATTPLTGVDALGLDVGSFAYKSRDSISSH